MFYLLFLLYIYVAIECYIYFLVLFYNATSIERKANFINNLLCLALVTPYDKEVIEETTGFESITSILTIIFSAKTFQLKLYCS